MELTVAQQAKLEIFREESLATALAHQEFNDENKETIEARITRAYELGGEVPPPEFVYVQSPKEANEYLSKREGKAKTEHYSSYILGMAAMYWIAFYKFCQVELDVTYEANDQELLDLHLDLAKYVSYWYPYDEVCVIVEKPVMTNWDGDQLHNEHGPSVLFADGFSVYSWRGTRIPKDWIEDKENALTAEVCLTWDNLEQRRCASEIRGWEKLLTEPSLNTTVIDKDEDPLIGTLLEATLPDVGRERFLLVACGTMIYTPNKNRFFALPVPPTVNTALEANAWTYDMKPEDFNLEVRT